MELFSPLCGNTFAPFCFLNKDDINVCLSPTFCVCSRLLKILCNLLAVDGVNDPDVLAINAGELNLSLHIIHSMSVFFKIFS